MKKDDYYKRLKSITNFANDCYVQTDLVKLSQNKNYLEDELIKLECFYNRIVHLRALCKQYGRKSVCISGDKIITGYNNVII